MLNQMVRALLVERYQMKVHYENRPEDAYSLVAAKPKLAKADPAGRTGCVRQSMQNQGRALLLHLVCRNMTMAEFAEQLDSLDTEFRYPVLDETVLPFQRGQPELELVDPVPEDLQLGLVGEPPLRGAAQSGEASARAATSASGTSRCGPCGPSTSRDGICPVRYQLRRAAREAPVSAAARSSGTQSEPSSWALSSSSSSQSSSRSSQSMTSALHSDTRDLPY